MLSVAGHGRDPQCCCCVFCTVEGKYETESVLAVQVEAVETLLREKTERSVQREGGRVVVLGLEGDLGEKGEKVEIRYEF